MSVNSTASSLSREEGFLSPTPIDELIRDLSDGYEQWNRLLFCGLDSDVVPPMCEEGVASALSHGLKNDAITVDDVRLRVPIEDRDGLVFPFKVRTIVDIVVQNGDVNGDMIAIEVPRGRIKLGDVSFFALKVELIAHQNPHIDVRGMLIVASAPQHVYDECRQYGIEYVGLILPPDGTDLRPSF